MGTTTKPEKHYWWYAVRILILVVGLSLGRVVFNYLIMDAIDNFQYLLLRFYEILGANMLLTLGLGAIIALIISRVKRQEFEMLYWKCMWYVALACVAVYLVLLLVAVFFLTIFTY